MKLRLLHRLKKLRSNAKFYIRWAIINRIKGRFIIRRVDKLLRRGQKNLDTGIARAEWFSDWIGGGLQKWAHEHQRSELWNEHAADLVDRARELKIKLHGEPPKEKAEPGLIFRGIVERKDLDKKKTEKD